MDRENMTAGVPLRGTAILDPDERERLRARIEASYIHRVAAELGTGRETLLRLVGGFSVRRSTVLAARYWLTMGTAP